jgi:hypothetical protein
MTRFTVKPSRLLCAIFTAAHVAGACLVFTLQIEMALKAALSALVVASLVHALLRHALLLTRGAIVAAKIYDNENATVLLRSRKQLDATILGTTHVSPRLTTINLRVIGERRTRDILLVRDNINSDDYRSVRVLLRWGKGRAMRGAAIRQTDGSVR